MSYMGPLTFGTLFLAGGLLWLLASRGAPQSGVKKKPKKGIRSTRFSKDKK